MHNFLLIGIGIFSGLCLFLVLIIILVNLGVMSDG